MSEAYSYIENLKRAGMIRALGDEIRRNIFNLGATFEGYTERDKFIKLGERLKTAQMCIDNIHTLLYAIQEIDPEQQ